MMSLFRNKYRVESARLAGWDYSTPGYYFVTVCTWDHGHLFGAIVNGTMVCNEFGQVVHDEWWRTGEQNQHIRLDEFVVMPNHFHGIIQIMRRIGCSDADIERFCGPDGPTRDDGSNDPADPTRDDGFNDRAAPTRDDGSDDPADPTCDDGSNDPDDPIRDDGSNDSDDPIRDDGSNDSADPTCRDVARNVSTMEPTRSLRSAPTAPTDAAMSPMSPVHGFNDPDAPTCTDVARNVSTMEPARSRRSAPTAPRDTAMSAIPPACGSLSVIMRTMKSAITKRINALRATPGAEVLQYRFHDHVIRDDHELFLIRQYMRNNPANWRSDRFMSDDPSVLTTPPVTMVPTIPMVPSVTMVTTNPATPPATTDPSISTTPPVETLRATSLQWNRRDRGDPQPGDWAI